MDRADRHWQAIIYVRVSTEDQADKGYSLEGQAEDCLQKAAQLGCPSEQVLVLADEASGAILDRPGLNRLRELVSGDSCPEFVIVYDPDRLARKLAHQLLITEEIIKRKITLEFVNFAWNNTPEGRMFYQLRGMFSEFEREKIRERTIRGRMTKLKNHGKLSYDPRLFGYRFDTVNDNLLPHPDEAETVRRIFSLAAEGESAAAIARRLAAELLPAPRGSRWYGSTVSRIIRNPSYLGTYMAYKVDYHQGFRRQRPPEEQFALPLTALVSAEVFAAAARTLERGRRHGRPRRAERLAAGRAVCAVCGRPMAAAYAASGAAYYRCPGGASAGASARSAAADASDSCAAPSHSPAPPAVAAPHAQSAASAAHSSAPPAVAAPLTQSAASASHSSAPPAASTANCPAVRYWNAEAVDILVWERVKAMLTRILSKELLLAGSTISSSSDRVTQPEISRLTARHCKLEERRMKLVDLYLTEGIDRPSYDRKLEEILTEETRLKEQIAQLAEMERENEIETESLSKLSRMNESERNDFLQRVEHKLETASFPLKQLIVEGMVECVYFHEELEITINYGLADVNE